MASLRQTSLASVLVLLSLVAGAAPPAQPGDTDASFSQIDLAEMLRRRRVPLVLAARDGDLETVRAELERGADPDLRMGNETALMNASLQGHAEVVRLLLEAGADPSAGIHPGATWTALRFAAMNGRLAALELLLEHEPAPPDAALREALQVAAEHGRPVTVTRLVEAGADIAAADADGTSPLMRASRGGHPQTISVLARLGAPLDAQDRKGRTALMFAAWLGRAKAVEALVAAGASAELTDADGRRAFPSDTAPHDFASIAARSHFEAEARPDACSSSIGYASLYRAEGEPVAARAYGLSRRPTTGSAAWIASYGEVRVLAAKIRSTEANEHPEHSWNAALDLPEAEASTVLAGRDSASALLLWPASTERPKLVHPAPADLPHGVFPESIQLALDTDGDDRADVLELSYCCKQPYRSDACEYLCGSYWQKTGRVWSPCELIQPE